MRLRKVREDHPWWTKLFFVALRTKYRTAVPGVVLVFLYRKSFFGKLYTAWTQELLRGPSEWSVGERELMASFTARLNECQYCWGQHGAIASLALADEALVRAVLDDYRTAPIPEKLRLMLGFLEKLTRRPDDVEVDDIAPLRAAGLSDAAIEHAIQIAANMNLINRLGDALGFAPHEASVYRNLGRRLLKLGYE
jgi:uncharacterized peroxidase-related enzyme